MLKTVTLKKNYEFKTVFSNGKYYRGKYIDIYMLKNNKNINIIGLAVGVKTAKAVKRNRIKRLIKESYRSIEKEVLIGNNMVFLWKNKYIIEKLKTNDIKEDIISIFKRAKIIK